MMDGFLFFIPMLAPILVCVSLFVQLRIERNRRILAEKLAAKWEKTADRWKQIADDWKQIAEDREKQGQQWETVSQEFEKAYTTMKETAEGYKSLLEAQTNRPTGTERPV